MEDDLPRCHVSLARDCSSREILDEQHTGEPLKPKRKIQSSRFGGVSWLEGGMFIRRTIDGLPEHIESLPEGDDVLDEVLDSSP